MKVLKGKQTKKNKPFGVHKVCSKQKDAFSDDL